MKRSGASEVLRCRDILARFLSISVKQSNFSSQPRGRIGLCISAMPSRNFHGRVTLGQGLDKEVCTAEQANRRSAHWQGLPNCSEARRRRRTV